MALQLILGPAGAGKSHYVYENLIGESMRHPDKTYLVIVPEQASMQTQKDLVALHPNHGIMNVDILSFQRLAWRIFGEIGGDLWPMLDDVGKSLVLQKIAFQNRKKLDFLGGNLRKPGYIDEVKSMLSELAQYRIRPEDMETISGLPEEGSLLGGKLKDLQTIYSEFQDYIEDRYMTPESVLEVLSRVADQSEILKDAVLVLDGFTGFTPVQSEILERLLSLASQVWVTVTMDPAASRKEKEDLFFMSRQMEDSLVEMAKRQRVEIKEPIYVDGKEKGRFCHNPALAFLEGHLFRKASGKYEERPEGLAILEALSPQKEIEAIAGKIRKMVREEGFRYRDIGFVTGDLTGYEDPITEIFTREGIPFFMDKKQPILLNPFVEYIRAALDLQVTSFSYESVFRYLRTGMSSVSRDKTDLLENYVIAYGIRGYKKWRQPFTGLYGGMTQEELDQINKIRQTFVEEVGDFSACLRGEDKRAVTKVKALYELLVRQGLEQKLEKKEKELEARGQHGLAKEYGQIYAIVMDLLDKLVAVLGEETMGMAEFQQILEAGLARIQVGIIPPTVDRVLVGDMERSRLPAVKVLFFAGVNEGVIPRKMAGSGILTEQDKDFLKERGVELAPTPRENIARERFYIYLCMTRSSEALYVSCSRTAGDGSRLGPAFVIRTLLRLFPRIIIEAEEGYEETMRKVEGPARGLQLLSQGMGAAGRGKEDEVWRGLYGWFFRQEDYREGLENIRQAHFYLQPRDWIGREAARALYGHVLKNSVTRLELYASCAFSHFLRYGLRLQERVRFEFRALDMGNIIHGSLERYSKRLSREGLSWTDLEENLQAKLVQESLEEELAAAGYEILQSSARNQALTQRLSRFLKRSIWAISRQLSQGDFEPGAYELAFNLDSNYDLGGGDQLRLRGKIDRVDYCQGAEDCLVRVIDYKTGSKKLDLTEVYYGLQLQLTIYLNAAMEIARRQMPDKKIRPAGIYYYQVEDPILTAMPDSKPDALEEAMLRSLRLEGLASASPDALEKQDRGLAGGGNSLVIPVAYKKDGSLTSTSSAVGEERIRLLCSYAQDKILSLGREILAGEAGARPYRLKNKKGCDYCPYHDICGFDERLSGCDYRDLEELTLEEVWDRMEKGEEKEGRRDRDGDDLDKRTK